MSPRPGPIPKVRSQTRIVSNNKINNNNKSTSTETKSSEPKILQILEESLEIERKNIEIQKSEMRLIAEQFVFMSHLTWQGSKKRYPNITDNIKVNNRIIEQIKDITFLGGDPR